MEVAERTRWQGNVWFDIETRWRPASYTELVHYPTPLQRFTACAHYLTIVVLCEPFPFSWLGS